MNTTKTFEYNSKIFSKHYKFLSTQIISVLSEPQALKMYYFCCENVSQQLAMNTSSLSAQTIYEDKYHLKATTLALYRCNLSSLKIIKT